MAGDYILPTRAVPGRFEKILKVFIPLAVIFLAAELVWLLGITPFKPFSRIDISGCRETEKSGLLFRAGLGKTSSFFSTDARAVERALAGISAIESVKVIKHFPDRLQILVSKRQAVASAFARLEGRTVPVLFDSRGVVFQVGGNEMDESAPRLFPVISGLVIEDPYQGMKLPGIFVPLWRELEKIENSAPELLAAVSELKINRKPFDGFDLVLYPVHRKIKVRLSELNEESLRYTLLMVDVLAETENGIETLDFRSGIASYIPKEASSE